MKTRDLIATLSADQRRPGLSLRGAILCALAAGVVAAAIGWMLMLGPRHDFMPAMHTPRFVFKFVVAFVLAATAALFAHPMAGPFNNPSRYRLLMLLAPALMIVGVGIELAMIPSARWMAALIGHNALICTLSIPAIAAVPLALMLLALRQGAPANPARTGAIAGVIAGGIAAFFYAAHCFDDSPLFVVTWYTLAIAFVSGAGALVGAKVLRW